MEKEGGEGGGAGPSVKRVKMSLEAMVWFLGIGQSSYVRF